MQAVEERLTFLEGQTREFKLMTDGVQGDIADLKSDTTRRFEAVDRCFDAVELRFDRVDRRFEAVEHRFDRVDRRFDLLEDRMSRQFMWIASIQVMTLAAVLTSLAAMLVRS